MGSNPGFSSNKSTHYLLDHEDFARIALKLADHKTAVVLVSSRKKMKSISITVGEQRITWKKSIEYLGIMIDN